LDFKVVNNTRQTVFLTEILFEVKESRLDPSPVLLMKSDNMGRNALHFKLLNEGWRTARRVRARFHLIPLKSYLPHGHPHGAGLRPNFRGPYPHQVDIGDVRDGVNVDIAHCFAAAGVDFKRLKKADEGWIWQGHALTAFMDYRLTPDEKRFVRELEACLGPFRHNGALVSGVLEYGARSIGGASEERSVRFQTIVYVLNAAAYPKTMASSYEYATKFESSGKNYQRRVSISQELKTGETDRFLVKIGFDKSSRHRFRARLLYNDQQEIVSPEIELLGFAPRSGTPYAEQQELH
jgi:hypothetical protein